MPRDANVRHSLPKAVFDRLKEGRRNDKPYTYTDADVRAIARFVSRPVNDFNQLEVDLANSAKARGGAPLPTKHEARLAWRKKHAQDKEELRRRVTERDAKKSLEERLAPRPLSERIAPRPATYTPVVRKPILIDFAKHSDKDRIGIFRPKIEATAKRLTPIVELIEEFPDAPRDHIRKFKHFLERLLDLRDALDERAPTIVAAQWQSLDWGLKEIGKISFGGIRRNYETVLRRVVGVVDNGYFEFLL